MLSFKVGDRVLLNKVTYIRAGDLGKIGKIVGIRNYSFKTGLRTYFMIKMEFNANEYFLTKENFKPLTKKALKTMKVLYGE